MCLLLDTVPQTLLHNSPYSPHIPLLCHLIPLSIFFQSFSHPVSLRPQPSALCALTCAWAPVRSPVEVIVCYHSGFTVLCAHCAYLFSSLQTHWVYGHKRGRERETKEDMRLLVFSLIMDVNTIVRSLCFFVLHPCTWCPNIHLAAPLSPSLYQNSHYSLTPYSFTFGSFSANCISHFLLPALEPVVIPC